MEHKILSVQNLYVDFAVRGGALQAIRGVDLDIYKGETVAIVGESGSGKSVFTKTFTGMLDENGKISQGQILFYTDDKTVDLAKLSGSRNWQEIRGGKIATVFQDPMTALNPVVTIGKQMVAVIRRHLHCSAAEAKRRALEMMEKVGIVNPEKRFEEYPFQYSGGMRQRIVIAIALSCQPEVLICDEPTTALDVTIQAQILQLIKKLQKELGFTVIFITHDLGVVANIADRVAVLYAGQIVELGTAEEIFYDPKHPYTWALLSALPQLAARNAPLYAIPGAPPSLYRQITADAFAPRNPYCLEIDKQKAPPMFSVSPTHLARTWLLDPRAPKIDKPERIQNLHQKLATAETKTQIDTAENGNREEVLSFHNVDIVFRQGKERITAVKNANFSIYKGETFSLVGESGSGKTTLGRAVMGIVPCASGEIRYHGVPIAGRYSRKFPRQLLSKIQMVFQDPAASLNERATVDYIISEGLYNFHLFENEADRQKKVERILREVGLLPEHLSRYPHEFSGGQRQRIGIARAMVMEPELVIADEPISALDVSVRAQVLNLMQKFQQEHGVTYFFIAHDLSVVRHISHRIGVIYRGNIVEIGESEELFSHPLHPYTQSLLSAIPIPDPALERSKTLAVYEEMPAEEERVLRPVGHNHLVLATEAELEAYCAQRKAAGD